jgi:hypothetical protein
VADRKSVVYRDKSKVDLYVPDGIIAHLTRECGGNVQDRHVVDVTCGSFERETEGPAAQRTLWICTLIRISFKLFAKRKKIFRTRGTIGCAPPLSDQRISLLLDLSDRSGLLPPQRYAADSRGREFLPSSAYRVPGPCFVGVCEGCCHPFNAATDKMMDVQE